MALVTGPATSVRVLTTVSIDLRVFGDPDIVYVRVNGELYAPASVDPCRSCLPLDLNDDCEVDELDASVFLSDLDSGGRWQWRDQDYVCRADLDGDADVDLADFAVFQAGIPGSLPASRSLREPPGAYAMGADPSALIADDLCGSSPGCWFAWHMTGPLARMPYSDYWAQWDHDRDGDVDLADFAEEQRDQPRVSTTSATRGSAGE